MAKMANNKSVGKGGMAVQSLSWYDETRHWIAARAFDVKEDKTGIIAGSVSTRHAADMLCMAKKTGSEDDHDAEANCRLKLESESKTFHIGHISLNQCSIKIVGM